MTFDDAVEWATNYLVFEWKLNRGFAQKIAVVLLYMSYYGFNPQINSGYRDETYQQQLIDRYESGDPTIIVRPANTSKHSTTDLSGKPDAMAIDIQFEPRQYGNWFANLVDVGWGGNFSNPDTVHFYEKG